MLNIIKGMQEDDPSSSIPDEIFKAIKAGPFVDHVSQISDIGAGTYIHV